MLRAHAAIITLEIAIAINVAMITISTVFGISSSLTLGLLFKP